MLGRHASRSSQRASEADIESLYRLLLGRDPDADGLARYRERVAAGDLPVIQVVAEMVGSPEYSGLHPARTGEDVVPTVVDTGDFKIFVDADDRAIGQAITATGNYEPAVTGMLRGMLRRGAVFVDVGANYGWHSLVAATVVGGTGHVIAVEPNPRNAALLRQSAEHNRFSNLTVIAVAAGEVHGFGALETDGSNGRIVSIDSGILEALACSFVVPIRRLEDVLEEAGDPVVDVIKIDVEGFELAALQGARRVIERDRPVIVSEFFPRALLSTGGVEPATYLDAVRELGYSISVIGRTGTDTDEEVLARLEGSQLVDIVATPV